jgi:hypothetical protein
MHNGALGLQRSAHLFLESIHILTTDGSHHLDAVEAAEESIPRLGHRSVVHKVDKDPPFGTFLPHPFHGELSLGNGESKGADLGTKDSSDDGDR